MQEPSPELRRFVTELQRRHGVSGDAVLTLARALVAGRGTMAQFSHPELGGTGQWSQGGMTQVGAMFDDALKARVAALCDELAAYLRRHARPDDAPADRGSREPGTPGEPAEASWWPAGLGRPASTGAQNDTRYAYFPESRRLAVQAGGRTTLHDTGDHRIGGVAQAQAGGGPGSLAFTSQHGPVRLADLPVVPTQGGGEGGRRE